jgi:PPOX class F420-dependent enzyme/OxyR family protein
MTSGATINIEGARKAFGTVVAPAGAGLHADPDRILALLGPPWWRAGQAMPGIGGHNLPGRGHAGPLLWRASRLPAHAWHTVARSRSGQPTIEEVIVSPFTEKEIEYLRGQRLGRLATVGGGGAPHIVSVGFWLDAQAETIEIGGHGLSGSKKWRDLQANPKVAFAVDDLASVDPWTPRG